MIEGELSRLDRYLALRRVGASAASERRESQLSLLLLLRQS